jgi:flagellar motor switch protein FliM
MQPSDTLTKDSPSGALLTEEELSALTEQKPKDAGWQQGAEKRHRVVPYDFRRPDRVSKEQTRSLYLLHDQFARNLSSNLPVFLRATSEATLMSVEQRAYAEYLSGLPNPAAIFKMSMEPLEGMAVLEMSPSVAYAVVDRQLGGPGMPIEEVRALTEIEQRVMEGFLRIVIDALRAAWKPIIDIEFQVLGCETDTKLLQIVPPNEIVLSIVFHIQVVDVRGTMSLCIPAINIEPIIQKLNESSYSRMHPNAPPDQTRALLDNLLTVSFPVAAQLRSTTASIDDLIRLAPGDLLRLDHRVEEPVEVSVGEIVKFHGDLVASESRTAVHVRPLTS